MALVSVGVSPKLRQPRAFAVRSFPPRCGPAAAPKPENAPFLPDPNPPPTPTAASPLVPTSCGPGTAIAPNRPNLFKRSMNFATRSFPDVCGNGPLLSKKRRVSTVRSFPVACRPDCSDSKKQIEETVDDFNDNARKMREEGRISGGIEESAVHVKCSIKKKCSPMADGSEDGRIQGDQQVEVRGDRLIVQALMAAKHCPWSKGRGRGFIGSQSRKKTSGVKERGKSAKSNIF